MMKAKKRLIYVVLVILLIISFFIDKNIISLVGNIKNSYLDILFNSVANFGSVIIVLIIMTTLFLYGERKREWIPVLWASFISSILICFILKLLIARPRPLPEIIYYFSNIINYSFPSMHAAASFAAVPILDKEFPRFKWFWVGFALLIAISRIYYSVHYLSDVIAGIILGLLIGDLFVYVEGKFKIFKRIGLKLF